MKVLWLALGLVGGAILLGGMILLAHFFASDDAIRELVQKKDHIDKGPPANGENQLKLTEVAFLPGPSEKKIEAHDILDVSFTPDGKELIWLSRVMARGGAGGKMVVALNRWDITQKKQLPALNSWPTTFVARWALTGDARDVVEWKPNGVRVLRGTNGQEVIALTDLEKLLSPATDALRVSSDGKFLATFGLALAPELPRIDRSELSVWDLGTGRARATLTREGIGPTCFAMSPLGETLAACFKVEIHDGYTVIWDVPTNVKIQVDHVLFSSLAFLPDGNSIAGIGETKKLILDAKTGAEKLTLKDRGTTSSRAYWSGAAPNGKWLAAHFGRELIIYDLTAGQEAARHTFAKHDLVNNRAVFSHDSKYLAVSGYRDLLIWQVEPR
jgi:WD40 repeat protein